MSVSEREYEDFVHEREREGEICEICQNIQYYSCLNNQEKTHQR